VTFVDRGELGNFLRERRKALQPIEVGLAAEGVRRTPGLRREEVAALAGMSAFRYGRLERGSGAEPTSDVVASLGRVLRLNAEEFGRLSRLAGIPEPVANDLYVEPGLMYVFDALADVPTYLLDEVTTIVARNALAVAVFGSQEWPMSNMAWGWFVGTRTRAMIDPRHHDVVGQAYVSLLRTATGWSGADHPSSRLIADLAKASADFARLWETTPTAPFRPIRLTLHHPVAGPLDISIEMVFSPMARHRVAMMRPEPGTDTWEKFDALRSSTKPSPTATTDPGKPATPDQRSGGPTGGMHR
jgi:hypothetical protein